MLKNNCAKSHKLRRKLSFGFVSFVMVFLASAVFIGGLSINTHAEEYVADTITGVVEAACTLVESNNEVTTTIANGQYKSNLGSVGLTVTCNDSGGFGIYSIGYSNDTEGTTVMKSSAGSNYDIATGTATSGSTSNWAMRVTPGTGVTSANSFDSYHVVPSSWTRVAEKSSGTADGSTTSATLSFQIFVSFSQPAGDYTGKVMHAVVHPSTKERP
jgi:hypothetical protein